MTVDEFVDLLDKTNPSFVSLNRFIRGVPDDFCFARKDKGLVEVVERFRAINREPVVDKKLRVVIGSFAHRAIRAELYRYHKALAGSNDHPYSMDEDSQHADAYNQEGMGYHFSSMSVWASLFGAKVQPIVGYRYRPDRFDRNLFLFYEVDML